MGESNNNKVVESSQEVRLSFSFFLFNWIIFTLLVGGLLFYFAINALPLQNPYFSFIPALLLDLLVAINSQYMVVIFLIIILPISPIDFSLKAITKSLLHKLLFIITSPLLVLEFIAFNYILDLNPVLGQQDSMVVLMFIFGFFPIFIWIFFTLWLWELFNGKNSSNLLHLMRSRNKVMDPVAFIQQNDTNLPQKKGVQYFVRWIIIMISLPFLLWYLTAFLVTNFQAAFLFILSFDFFMFLLLLPAYTNLLNERGYECLRIRKVYTRIFGPKDISQNIGLFGTLFIIFLPLMDALLDGHISNFSFLIFCGFSYIGMIVIFLSVLFSNQIKDFFNITDKKWEDDDVVSLYRFDQ